MDGAAGQKGDTMTTAKINDIAYMQGIRAFVAAIDEEWEEHLAYAYPAKKEVEA